MQLKIALETIVVGILAAFALILGALYVNLPGTHHLVQFIKEIIEPSEKVIIGIIVSSEKTQSPFAYTVTIILVSILFSFCYIFGICINHVMFSLEKKYLVPNMRKTILEKYSTNKPDLEYLNKKYYCFFERRLNIKCINQNTKTDIALFFGKIKACIFQKYDTSITSYDRLEERRRLLRGSIPSLFLLLLIFSCDAVKQKWLILSTSLFLSILLLLISVTVLLHLWRSIKLQNETLLRNFLVYFRTREAINESIPCDENHETCEG